MPEDIEELENAHFDAGIELEEVALDWAIAHSDTLRDSAANGCVESARLIAAVDRYFETWRPVDEAITRKQFDDIMTAEGLTDA